MSSLNAQEFVAFALQQGVLRFGEFKTKSGRVSPYFFDAGLFNNGESIGLMGQFYARALIDSGLDFDMLFGPSYKGIPLVTATAIAMAGMGQSARAVPYAFNRKEAKDHGEGGVLVGAPMRGKVVIVDDVITAGTSVRESVRLIRAAGAEPVAVLISLDRMERAGDANGVLAAHSAVQEVSLAYAMPVVSIASLDDVMAVIKDDQELVKYSPAVQQYRQRYGI